MKNLKIKFIDYSQRIDDVYENLGDYNPTKKRKFFDDMIVDMVMMINYIQATVLQTYVTYQAVQ